MNCRIAKNGFLRGKTERYLRFGLRAAKLRLLGFLVVIGPTITTNRADSGGDPESALLLFRNYPKIILEQGIRNFTDSKARSFTDSYVMHGVLA